MKNRYLFLSFLSVTLFLGCSKDFLKSYEKRIVGTWRISDVDKIGFGGNISNLPFTTGTFTFYDNGSLDYTNDSNNSFKGTWQIDKRVKDDQTHHSLQITAVDFTNQQVLSEYYDVMNFSGTNHIRAEINSDLRTYVTHFKR